MISVFSVLIGFLLSWLAHDWLFTGIPGEYLNFSLVLIPLMLMNTNFRAIIIGMQDFKVFNLIDVVSNLILLVATFLLVWLFRWGIYGAVITMMISNLYAALAAIVYIRKQTGGEAVSLIKLPDWHYMRKVMTYGFQAYLANLVSFLTFRIDKFILNNMANSIAVGFYDLSVGLAERLWIISNAISSVLMVRVAAADGAGKYNGKFSMSVARNVLLVSFLIGLALFPFADWVIVLLYGEEFRAAARISSTLAGYHYSLSLTGSFLRYLGRGHPEDQYNPFLYRAGSRRGL